MFALGKIVWWLVNPGNLLLALIVLGTLALLVGWRRLARLCLVPASLVMLALTFTPLRDALVVPLEQRFPPPAPTGHDGPVDGIIVLGGAISTELSAIYQVPVVNGQGGRLLAFAELARRHPQAKLVFTGGSASLVDDSSREADHARVLFAGLGLDPARVIWERESRSTRENALFSKDLAKPEPGQRWLLVTSALHMPRSVGVFRAAGWPVIAHPAPYISGTRAGAPPYALSDGLDYAEAGVREWLGLVYYYLNGWTDTLFPAP